MCPNKDIHGKKNKAGLLRLRIINHSDVRMTCTFSCYAWTVLGTLRQMLNYLRLPLNISVICKNNNIIVIIYQQNFLLCMLKMLMVFKVQKKHDA